MALLTKTAILTADDLPHRDIEVREWGGTVRVRTMTGSERDAWESALVRADGSVNAENIRARLCALTLIGADGKRLFTDAEVKALGAKSAAALDRVFDAARKLNGLSDQDVEDLAKN